MENFGEITINPEKKIAPEKISYLEDKKNLEKEITEIKPEKKQSNKRRALVEYIKKFDKAHKNEGLTPEQKKSRRKKIYTGIALVALSGGGYLYDKIDDLDEPPRAQKELAIKDDYQTKTDNLSKLREQLNKEYKEKDSKTEKEKIAEIKKDEKPTKERLEKAHNLTIEIQAISRNLLKNDTFFPKKMFSSDFLLAIQAQESGFDKSAQSHKGAVGSMQVMPETIKETLLYVNKIDKRLSFEEKDISKDLVNDLIYLIKQNPELGKAFGNLYLAEIFNNFEIGKKSLENNWISLGRKKILATYNWGIRKFMKNATDEESWPSETKNYIENIFADKKIFDQINAKLGIDENNKKISIEKDKNKKIRETLDLKSNPEHIKEAIILEIRKFRDDKNIEFARMNIEEIVNYYLGEIKIKEKLEKRILKKEEVKKITKELNFKIFKNFVAREGFLNKQEKTPI